MNTSVTFNAGTPKKVTIWQDVMWLTKDIVVRVKKGVMQEPIIRITSAGKAYRIVNLDSFPDFIQDAIKKAIPGFNKMPIWDEKVHSEAKGRKDDWLRIGEADVDKNFLNLKS